MDIIIKKIDKEILTLHVDDFLSILREDPLEYWDFVNLNLDLPGKFLTSFGAWAEDILVGFIIASFKGDSVHIHKFMVKSTFRNQGIGATLQYGFEQNCLNLNFNHITLHVYLSNNRAIRFYEQHGFLAKETRKDSVNQLPLLKMSKSL